MNIPPKTKKAGVRLLQAALPFVTYKPLVDEIANFLLTGDASFADISKTINASQLLEYNSTKLRQTTDYHVAWYFYNLTSLTWYTDHEHQQRVIDVCLIFWFKELKKRIYHEKPSH